MNKADRKRCRELLTEAMWWAERECTCSRKSTATVIAVRNPEGVLDTLVMAHNGPSKGHQCSGEVGNCGCAHAEPRALMYTLNLLNREDELWLLTQYSPCTNCANAIVDASELLTNLVGVAWVIDTEHDMRGANILAHSKLERVKL
jgi:deoxycytidylate deaminase